MHKQYFVNDGLLSVLSCFIQQCVYIRFACHSEGNQSNPVLRTETLVVHCQEDDSTPSLLAVDLSCRILKEMFDILNETTDVVYHRILTACGLSKLFPWPVKTGKRLISFVPNFIFISRIDCVQQYLFIVKVDSAHNH